MPARLAAFALVVPDYDEAIRFYVSGLGFKLVEDTRLSETKRWVLVEAPGGGSQMLLACAASPEQTAAIGNQTGGRVVLFLHTDDFERDRKAFTSAGAEFIEEPRREDYGIVGVFKDPFGNKWDLIEPASS